MPRYRQQHSTGPSTSKQAAIDRDEDMARALQEEMDIENQQCAWDRKVAQAIFQEAFAEAVQTKASMTDQQPAELDVDAVQADVMQRTFVCPIVHESTSKEEGVCVGMWNAKHCNHWISREALDHYIVSKLTDLTDAALLPCPQCLADPCPKCDVHGQGTGVKGGAVCCIPERQLRALLSQEQLLRLSKQEFIRYRDLHDAEVVRCPKPTCDYWCELTNDAEACVAPEIEALHRSHSFGSSISSEGHYYGLQEDHRAGGRYGGHRAVAAGGASTSAAAAAQAAGDRVRGRNAPRQPQQHEKAVIEEGLTMHCMMCDVEYCLYCSEQVGVPVRGHGQKPCKNVIKQRKRNSGTARKARKRRGEERSKAAAKGISYQECPTCKEGAWRDEGECNLMTCRCRTKFCLLCGEDVGHVDHQHFNDERLQCYKRCWHRPDGGKQGRPPCRCGAPGCLPAEPQD